MRELSNLNYVINHSDQALLFRRLMFSKLTVIVI